MSINISRHFYLTFLLILFFVFLIIAGISRYLETDAGNILIHDIDVESYEGFFYGGRLFRPLKAGSMNQRPAVLLLTGSAGDRYTGDTIAMEFARRGFVTLTLEDFSQGKTASQPDYYTENLVDAGYMFLATRSFTDHNRIGLVAYFDSAEKALESNSLDNFADAAFIYPTQSIPHSQTIPDNVIIYPENYQKTTKNIPVQTLYANYISLLSPKMTSTILEQLHESLSIPDDSPFWFNSNSQKAGLLSALRVCLAFLLMTICIGTNELLLFRAGNVILKIIVGSVLALILFIAIGEFLNSSFISVRLGSPFHYLPRFSQILSHFSIYHLIFFVLISMVLSIRINKLFIADFISILGFLLSVFISIRWITEQKIWNLNVSELSTAIIITMILSCTSSLLLRLPSNNQKQKINSAILIGTMNYFYFSQIPPISFF